MANIKILGNAIFSGKVYLNTGFTVPLESPPLPVVNYDTYFNNYTIVLLNGESSSTATNNVTFVDSSSSTNVITFSGTPSQNSFSPYAPNGWAVSFGGSSRLSVPPGTDFAFGTGAFTVEAWIYTNAAYSTLGKTIYSQTASGHNYFVFGVDSSSRLYFIGASSGAGTSVHSTSSVIVPHTWTHVACVREGVGSNQLKFYINGAPAGTATNDVDFTNTSYRPSIGAYSHETTNQTFNGYISNLRVIKGQAIYTGNFTPSVSPLTNSSVGATGAGAANSLTGTVSLLACQNAFFKDNSSLDQVITIAGSFARTAKISPFSRYRHGGSSSVYFDGSTKYLRVSANPDFAFGTGDFTVECWYHPTGTIGGYPIALEIGNSNTAGGLSFHLHTNFALKPSVRSAGSILNTTPTVPILNYGRWNHIVWQRKSGNVKVFVNGFGSSNVANTTNYTQSSAVSIGYGFGSSSGYATGFLSNLRAVKGQALYDGDFEVPSAEYNTSTVGTTGNNVVSSLTGTVVLLACKSGESTTDSSTFNRTITAFGGTASTNNAPFIVETSYDSTAYSVNLHGGSVAFDGSSSLVVPRSNTFMPAASTDFTIESWVYLHTTPSASAAQIVGLRNFGGTSDWALSLNSSRVPILWVQSANTTYTAGSALSLNEWCHVAVTRSGTGSNNLKWYVNGKSAGSSTTNATLSGNGTSDLTIGTDSGNDGSKFTGLLTDVRIINGQSVYSANFNVPTQPLSATANTVFLLNAKNAAVYNHAANSEVLLYGGATTSSAVKKFGSKSLYFDGVGDYAVVEQRDGLDTTDIYRYTAFTLEAWIYPLAIDQDCYIFSKSDPADGSPLNYAAFISNTNKRLALHSWHTSTGTTTWIAPSGTVTLSAWNHVAWCYDGVNASAYLNGTLVMPPTAVSYTDNAFGILQVGQNYIGAGSYTGYMDDVRITRGVCRYTANSFNVPTEAFPAL